MAEDRVVEFEDRSIKIIQIKEQREKKKKKKTEKTKRWACDTCRIIIKELTSMSRVSEEK